jgi:hypothetical protein
MSCQREDDLRSTVEVYEAQLQERNMQIEEVMNSASSTQSIPATRAVLKFYPSLYVVSLRQIVVSRPQVHPSNLLMY